jgi:hypothetical protein
MKNNEMDEACSKYGGEKSYIQGSGGETCRRENLIKIYTYI